MEAMSSVEWLAALLGVICVALVVRRSIWNFAFGIASTALYVGVFVDAKLYSDALLQIFFVVVNGYGWLSWRRAQAKLGDVVVETMGVAARVGWLGGIALATLCWGWLMHRFTDAAYPWIDAGVAITSVAAQILMARRKLENWMLWIAIDIVAIPLFASRGLWVTSGLYALYLIMSVTGLIGWRRALRLQETSPE